MPESCGVDTEANELYELLLGTDDVTVPLVDFTGALYSVPSNVNNPLYASIDELETADLTTRQIGGTGVFDALMESVKTHLKEEFSSNRITGAEYTKAYIALVAQAMGTSAQFLLGKEQARWQAISTQMQARVAETQLVAARVDLETAKNRSITIRFEALTAKSSFTLGKIRLANEGVNYCISKFNLSSRLPLELEVLGKQRDQTTKQIEMVELQKGLVNEQIEGQRAQTLDTRRDGAPVAGSVGQQKELQAQQVVSYQRDADVKVAKVFTDAWITMKTVDEGLAPPDNFTNANINSILTALKVNNGMS